VEQLELKNKKINFLGDSITEGVGVSCTENIYLNVMKRELPLAEARNYGIGGTRIAIQQHPSNPEFDRDFISRICLMDEDADIVTVLGGTNDFGHGDAPVGSWESGERTGNTFCGACRLLAERLITRFPRSVIVLMTPLHRVCEESPRGDGSKQTDAAPLSVYVDILRRAAEYYSLPLLDLYSCSGIQPNVPILSELYCPDGLHPNDAGHRIIASRLEGFLRTL
jgi:lysophospholipase L1-like esterase